MGQIKPYPPVKYFSAITFSTEINPNNIYDDLEKLFSPIDSKSEIFNFDRFTSYYQTEMGKGLQKQIVSFLTLMPAEKLPAIKTSTNEIEKKYISEGKRTVNIDPGYLTTARMVLATTKDYDHRIYLGMGIFGDIHYRFRKGHFQNNDWTYPDYQQDEIRQYFEKLRTVYLGRLKTWNSGLIED